MALFDIKNLVFCYPNAQKNALDNVSLSIEEGGIVLVLGANGSGKTTLLRHLKKELKPHGKGSGEVLYNGAALDSLDVCGDIGYVAQNPDNQIVAQKVLSELAFGLENAGVETEEINRRIAETAAVFGLLQLINRDTFTLSGGQKQTLNLASVIAMRPRVLILDEPFAALDPIAARTLADTLVKLNRDYNITLVISGHENGQIFPFCTDVVIMQNGRITYNGNARQITAKDTQGGSDTFIAAALPAPARLFKGLKLHGDCPLSVNEAVNYLKKHLKQPPNTAVGAAPEKQGSSKEQAEIAVRMKDVYFRYSKGGEDVLSGADFEIRQGDFCAVLGANGSGKTTALQIMSGILTPFRGTVEVFSKRIKDYKNGALYKNCAAVLPQFPQMLFTKKTVLEELRDMCGEERMIEEFIHKLGLEDVLPLHPYDLSGGEMKKTALAKVLLLEPRILFLDEPAAGLDALAKKEFGKLLAQLNKEGLTVVMATHDTGFAAGFAKSCSMCFGGALSGLQEKAEFFGGNYFYTTAANVIARSLGLNSLTVQELIENLEGKIDKA